MRVAAFRWDYNGVRMALTSGKKLGPYEIVSALGAGGMGEVYRAHDTRLGRDVAIKVLPADLSSNPDLKARFDREARAISALSHPHICHLYDVGSQDGTDYLVMELLEGESLQHRLDRGPLPLLQALQCAIQVAEALEKAHKSGIVHRDLKPGNVMLTRSGAKLLDFGLAKPVQGLGAMASGSVATMSRPLTQEGKIVGTFQYMAPEQVQGQEADARTDIFALGALLYEMVTGKRAFAGKTQISVMSAILEKEPEPISVVHPLTPHALDHVVQRALAKDPDERWQSVADLKAELKWISTADRAGRTPEAMIPHRSNRVVPALVAACVLLGLALFVSIVLLPKAAPAGIEVRASIPAPEKAEFLLMDDDAAGPVVISPDGTNIAFTARDDQGRTKLWVRALNGGEAHPLTGTEQGTYPFWSPDSKWLGFFANGKLKKAPMETGPVLDLADAPRGRGGSWGSRNIILFAPEPSTTIFAISANGGGSPRPVTAIDRAIHSTHRWPVWLADGKRFLYFASSHGNAGANEHNGIYLASLDGTPAHMLIPTDSNAVIAPGYLLYVQSDILMAVPFNEGRGELNGDAAPVAQDISHNPGTWRSAVDVSRNGILVYQAGNNAKPSELLWLAPGNKSSTRAAERDNYRDLRLSPDGRKLAVTIGAPHAELWIYDLTRNVKTRLTFSDNAFVSTSAWAPDGKRVAFSIVGSSGTRMFTKEAGGSGKQEQLTSEGTILDTVDDWSNDGQYLLYHAAAPPAPLSLYALPMKDGSKPIKFLSASPFPIVQARFSPNGKWVAYLSPESGSIEAYVTSFPEANGKWQISADGAVTVRWILNGQALLYERGDGTILKVPFAAHGNNADIGAGQPYLIAHPRATTYYNSWEVAADGRIIANTDIGGTAHTISLVMNWTAGLKK